MICLSAACLASASVRRRAARQCQGWIGDAVACIGSKYCLRGPYTVSGVELILTRVRRANHSETYDRMLNGNSAVVECAGALVQCPARSS